MSGEALETIPESLAALAEINAPQEAPVDTPKPAEEAKPVEADPLVEKAKASGWRPKDEFEGDPDQWVDAGEFVRRKPLFDQLHELKKQNKRLEENSKQLAEFAANASKRAREQAIAEIEAQKKQAFEAGDYQAFAEADKQQKQIEQAQQPVQPQTPEIPPEVQDFAKRNERWFEKDADMTEFAIDRARYYRERGIDFGGALQKAEQDVRRFYADKFVNPNKDKPAAVVSENGDKRSAGKLTYNDLSREERSVWQSLKNHMTFDEFIKDLRA